MEKKEGMRGPPSLSHIEARTLVAPSSTKAEPGALPFTETLKAAGQGGSLGEELHMKGWVQAEGCYKMNGTCDTLTERLVNYLRWRLDFHGFDSAKWQRGYASFSKTKLLWTTRRKASPMTLHASGCTMTVLRDSDTGSAALAGSRLWRCSRCQCHKRLFKQATLKEPQDSYSESYL